MARWMLTTAWPSCKSMSLGGFLQTWNCCSSKADGCFRKQWYPQIIHFNTSGRFKSYRSGGSRIILRARSILMTFIIFGNSTCIIFAVVRSTLLLLHFHLHSLFFRRYLVSLQYFDDFCSYAALVHVSFLLLCAVLRCFWAFICILCAFVISLCAHSILMFFFHIQQ